jgi:hypothetical protein
MNSFEQRAAVNRETLTETLTRLAAERLTEAAAESAEERMSTMAEATAGPPEDAANCVKRIAL